jgi:exodeoxyribonuclease VIII
LHEAKASGQPITQVLDAFSAYMRQFGPHVRIWSCGADFDLPILNHLYAVTGKQAPWKYANSRCYRTLKNLATGVEMERSGVHHNALADAKSQAAHAIKLLSKIAEAQR